MEVTPHSLNHSAMSSRPPVKVPNLRTGRSLASRGTQAQCSREPISTPAAWTLTGSQTASIETFLFCFFRFDVLLFMGEGVVPAQEWHEKLESLNTDCSRGLRTTSRNPLPSAPNTAPGP